MPLIIITTMSPAELFKTAHRRASAASAEIRRLKHAPLAPGETLHDRLLVVAQHADVLAEAFEIIEALAATVEDMPRQSNDSPPASREESLRDHDDTSTN